MPRKRWASASTFRFVFVYIFSRHVSLNIYKKGNSDFILVHRYGLQSKMKLNKKVKEAQNKIRSFKSHDAFWSTFGVPHFDGEL